jgi:hypothetical protein
MQSQVSSSFQGLINVPLVPIAYKFGEKDILNETNHIKDAFIHVQFVAIILLSKPIKMLFLLIHSKCR